MTQSKFSIFSFGPISRCLGLLAALVTSTGRAHATDADLAKQLSNPIANLISVPFQINTDSGFGSSNGKKTTLNIQPVIPFQLSDDLT